MRSSLRNFIGISRRFELIGSYHGCHIYDDYAHHPTEVRAVLQAVRQRFPSNALLVAFQPRTYSRLAAFKEDFAKALSDADQVLVTEVYSAREKKYLECHRKGLSIGHNRPPSEYIPTLEEVVDKLALEVSEDPNHEIVVLTLGAGDITEVGPKLFHKLQQKS